MRLKPPVSEAEALDFLTRQAASTWNIEVTEDVERTLVPTAKAMVTVSSFEVPDDVEPWLL